MRAFRSRLRTWCAGCGVVGGGVLLWCGAGWLAVWRFACPLPCAVGTAGGLGSFFRRLAPLPVSSFSFPFVVAVAVVPRLACRLAHWADGLARGSVASVGSLLGWLVAGHRAHAAGWLGGPQGFGPCGRSLGVPRWVAGSSLLLLVSGRRDVCSQPDMCCRSFVVFFSFLYCWLNGKAPQSVFVQWCPSAA